MDQQIKTILIIGNGPSTKELINYGLNKIPSHIDTFGMGLAYKYFSKVNWWPTYYAAIDKKVVANHQGIFRSLVLDENIPVRKFFFSLNLAESKKFSLVPHGSTGDFCFRKSIELQYDQIFVIGIDLDYKPLQEATRISRREFDELGLDIEYDTNVIYKIRRPVKDNPNYFFPYYQEVGDVYTEPRGNSWHLLAWYRARELAETKMVTVRNVGSSSLLPFFHKLDISVAFEGAKKNEATFPETVVSELAAVIFRAEKSISDNAEKRFLKCNSNLMDFSISLEELNREAARRILKQQEKQIRISVIIPCFNAEIYISTCLESLMKQTLFADEFEVICVDDCSTDKTTEIIAYYQSRMQNLKLVSHEVNKKQGAARNTGLVYAQGQYITFLDADDFLRLDALESLFGIAEGRDLVVAQHRQVRYDRQFDAKNSNRRISNDLKYSALTNTIGWWPVGMLISRRLIEEHKIRFREGVFFEDIDFVVKLCFVARNYIVSKEQIYYYLNNDTSTVMTMSDKKLHDAIVSVAETIRVVQTEFKHGVEPFVETSTKWFLRMAQRIQSANLTLAEKEKLSNYFFDILKESGISKYFDAEFRSLFESSALRVDSSFADNSHQISEFNYFPWGTKYEGLFKNKVIFYCEVDYHIRNAAPIVRKLKNYGVESIVVDASRSTCFTSNRPLPENEEKDFADIEIIKVDVAKELPFATEAAAFIFMNDLTYTKQLIFENFGFGVPTIGFYEGINDDWNLDRKAVRRPYRSVDYLLIPGIYQKAFYEDRQCYVVGLSNIESRLSSKIAPSAKLRAIINVNFTYGVLENCRDAFVKSAVQACYELGLEYVISQHPADKADLSHYNVASQSVYDLLSEGGVLISRFSTTILEALAMGRPVVYHNPHAERVPKFSEPLGAYHTSTNKEELVECLHRAMKHVEPADDIRRRASLFLHNHCNICSMDKPDDLAAQAIIDIVSAEKKRLSFKAKGRGVFLDAKSTPSPHRAKKDDSRTGNSLNVEKDLLKSANELYANNEFLRAKEQYSKLYKSSAFYGFLKFNIDLCDRNIKILKESDGKK